MDLNTNIDLIVRELDEVRDIMDDLKKYHGVPILEIELAKSKIRNVAEVIIFLKREEEKPNVIKTGDTQPADKKPTPGTKEAEVSGDTAPAKKEKEERQPPDMLPDEEKKDPGKPAVEHPEDKPYVAPIIADTFSHLSNRFNEQIGDKGDDFSYVHGRRYTSLSEAIGVNDKFYYVREIFHGNRDDYNEAITRLEKAENINEAKSIILGYRKEKTLNEASRQLLNLVKRNFPAHE
jgi:hypothetical protein